MAASIEQVTANAPASPPSIAETAAAIEETAASIQHVAATTQDMATSRSR